MKNLFKNLFSKREEEAIVEIEPQNENDKLIVEKVIKKLQSPGDNFTSRWYDRKKVEKSVRSIDKNTLIIIETGQIVMPFEPKMTPEQKEIVKNLIKPIVEKNIKYIIDTYI